MIIPRNLEGESTQWSRGAEVILGTLGAESAPKAFWSVDHVAFEAVAAYADGNLGEKAAVRAREHFRACSECCDQLQAQLQARAALRQSSCVQVPADLLGALRAIPTKSAIPTHAFPTHEAQRGSRSGRPGSAR
ncbi:MAG: zf-HC2 domain-containing protein [Segniliparus sp.]|uniref:zf-HC2 domain-containing protein n=1 Tax=Segniliparus sp. TaxID=2804064 RepID=UPI003F2D1227